MKEFFARLFSKPGVAVELITASFFINALAMASPIFVMQVLNRYVSQGVDATLITLTAGVAAAATLEFFFRQARMHLTHRVNIRSDEDKALQPFSILTRAKISALERIAPDARREVLSGSQAIETAYSAQNIGTILDVPFALLFVFVLYLLSPLISGIVFCFLVAVFLAGILGTLSVKGKTVELTSASGFGTALISTAIRETDTVHTFNAGSFLRRAWEKNVYMTQHLRRAISSSQGLMQTITQSATGYMTIAVISVGAIQVVRGELDVGALIGANILASRALQPISKFSQLGTVFAKAREALAMIANFASMPLEPERGSALAEYSGRLELRDMAFAFSGNNNPLFESVSLRLDPGSVLVITGANGVGKTTFARLLIGLLEPTRGQIFVDGLDLAQVAPEWWRRQIVHLPQEPALLNATILENLQINNPDIDGESLNRIIDATGLRRFMDESQDGFDTVIAENGWRLSEGIRRRIALARGLTTDGKLVILDEPTESLDAEGAAAVHAILGHMAQQGRTIIIMSHDAKIVKGQHMVLDLNTKPIPELVAVEGQSAQPQQAQPQQPQPQQPQQAQPQQAQPQQAQPQQAQPQKPRILRPAE